MVCGTGIKPWYVYGMGSNAQILILASGWVFVRWVFVRRGGYKRAIAGGSPILDLAAGELVSCPGYGSTSKIGNRLDARDHWRGTTGG